MKRKLDIMSVAGVVLAVILMVIGIVLSKNLETKEFSINFASLGNFFDETSIAIVIGGTFAGLMIMFPLSQFAKIPKHVMIIFMPRQYEPQVYIQKMAEYAKTARVSGLLSLETEIANLEDAFMKKGLQMIVDSVDAQEVKAQLESALDNLDERHANERAFYDKGAALGPAFGMIGTLIGLVNMLKNLTDIESVGPNMAVALITTFYGSCLANIVFAPISNKLRVRHEEEYLCMRIISEGIQAIQAGSNPKLVEDKLIGILPQYQQSKYFGGEGGEGGKKKGKAPKEPKAPKK